MRLEQTEKAINRIDHDIDSLITCKKYLDCTDKIEYEVERLNKDRQGFIDELCREDWNSYLEVKEYLRGFINKELFKEQQLEILSQIKETFGRKAPTPGKNSHGLNAWLKALNVTTVWENIEGQDWATLTIKGFEVYSKDPTIREM